jgi:hypothetical protein
MLTIIYLFPVAAWLAYTYHMHHSGGRPTTYQWWALMTGVGVFELSKGIAAEITATSSVVYALGTGVLAALAVIVVQSRRTWHAGALEGSSAPPATN